MRHQTVELAGALGSALDVVERIGNSALCAFSNSATNHSSRGIDRFGNRVDPIDLLVLGVLLELQVVVLSRLIGRILHRQRDILTGQWRIQQALDAVCWLRSEQRVDVRLG